MSNHELMQQMYDDDINAYIGLDHSHMGFWTDENAANFHRAQEQSLVELANSLDIQTGQTILDIGGGQGSTAIWLAEHYHCQVMVVDIVPAMIAQAKIKVEQKGLGEVITLQCADILNLETEQHFDRIISVEAIHHISDKDALFQKCHSLLKPGGRFAVSVYWSDMHWRWLENFYLMLTVGDKNICKPERYRRAIDNSGFSKLKERDISSNVLPKSSKILSSEPYLSKIKGYHRKHFGRLVTSLLPLFLLWNRRVIKNQKLHLSIFSAEKPHS